MGCEWGVNGVSVGCKWGKAGQAGLAGLEPSFLGGTKSSSVPGVSKAPQNLPEGCSGGSCCQQLRESVTSLIHPNTFPPPIPVPKSGEHSREH